MSSGQCHHLFDLRNRCFVFGTKTRLRASLQLVFLVPTTLIFHTFPMDSGLFMNLALIGALSLALTRSTAEAVPSIRWLPHRYWPAMMTEHC